MSRRRTARRIVVVGGVIALGCGGFAVASGSPSSPSPPAVDQILVQRLAASALPGATARLAGGSDLVIKVPARLASKLPASDDPAFRAPAPTSNAALLPLAQLGWKTDMVTGAAYAENPRIGSSTVSWPGITASQQQLISLGSRGLAGRLTLPDLGAVSASKATQQATSNLAVLKSVLPRGTITASRILTVPLDKARNIFGLEIDLRVHALIELATHAGDVQNGLATGLWGNDHAVVAGLAINLLDDQGRRTGWWSITTLNTGFAIVDPTLANPPYPNRGGTYPNLTGGPGTMSSSHG